VCLFIPSDFFSMNVPSQHCHKSTKTILSILYVSVTWQIPFYALCINHIYVIITLFYSSWNRRYFYATVMNQSIFSLNIPEFFVLCLYSNILSNILSSSFVLCYNQFCLFWCCYDLKCVIHSYFSIASCNYFCMALSKTVIIPTDVTWSSLNWLV
jgi:hypothetical protein